MKLVVAITGASGAIYPQRLLMHLGAIVHQKPPEIVRGVEALHVVVSKNAELVWATELESSLREDLGEQVCLWERDDFSAPFASGSNAPDAVVVSPCSMSTLARVAHGGGGDLIARSCEVALKERRPLILNVRETPLSRVHLQNMLTAHDAGASIMPAIPSFYSDIRTLPQAVDTVVGRVFDHLGLDHHLVRRWGEAL